MVYEFALRWITGASVGRIAAVVVMGYRAGRDYADARLTLTLGNRRLVGLPVRSGCLPSMLLFRRCVVRMRGVCRRRFV